MVLGGWISFSDKDEDASMTIHKNEVKKDTEEAVQKGEDLVKDAAREGRKLLDKAEDEIDTEEPVEAEPDVSTEQPQALETPRWQSEKSELVCESIILEIFGVRVIKPDTVENSCPLVLVVDVSSPFC